VGGCDPLPHALPLSLVVESGVTSFICLLGLVAGTSGSTGSRLWEVLSPSALQLVFLIASLFSKHLYCLVFSAQRWNPNLSLCGFSGF
jgi:hypothetical protein